MNALLMSTAISTPVGRSRPDKRFPDKRREMTVSLSSGLNRALLMGASAGPPQASHSGCAKCGPGLRWQ